MRTTITSADQIKVWLDRQNVPFIPHVRIRDSYYAINAANVNGGVVTSLMGQMTSGRGKVGMTYKIPLSLYTQGRSVETGFAVAPNAVIFTPRPRQPISACNGTVGDKFWFKGHEYTITGFNPARPKNAVSLRREDGRQMKGSVDFVNTLIRQKENGMTPAQFEALTRKFHKAMVDLYHRTLNETGYKAGLFLKMLNERGGRITAKDLINNPKIAQEGFTELCLLKRLDLTVEAYVMEHPQYWPLFTPEERRLATLRLRFHEYKIRAPEIGAL